MKEQVAGTTGVIKQEEPPQEAILDNTIQEASIGMEETEETTRTQEDTGSPMGEMEVCSKHRGPMVEDLMEDQISTQTVRQHWRGGDQ